MMGLCTRGGGSRWGSIISVIPIVTRQWVMPHSLEHVYADSGMRQGSFPRSRQNVLVAYQRQEIVKGARKPGGIVNSVKLGGFQSRSWHTKSWGWDVIWSLPVTGSDLTVISATPQWLERPGTLAPQSTGIMRIKWEVCELGDWRVWVFGSPILLNFLWLLVGLLQLLADSL